ncbi:hypothetical protein [Deinococcus proteolyticus]|nr:hypothetical protein [Deinococcus proteolyticus]
MKKWPQLNALPEDNRLWMLIWLGPLEPRPGNSQPGLLAFLAAIPYSARRSPAQVNYGRFPQSFDLERVLRVEFSLGDLPALHVGMMFRNRKLVRNRRPLTITETFLADFDSHKALRLTESPDLNATNTLTGNAWDMLSHSGYVALETNSRRLLVPALELIRWSYGTSSRVLQSIVSGEIGSVLSEISQSGVLQDGIYKYPLPKGFPATDTPQLAWLTLDPVARKAALQLANELSVGQRQTSQGLFVYPKVAFPYRGLRRFTCQGRYLADSFLVTRIIDLDLSLPFNEVQLLQESGEAYSSMQLETQTRTLRRKVKNASQISLHSNIEPQSNRSAVLLPALPALFSDRVPISLQHSDREGHSSFSPFFIPSPRHLTTGTGQDRSSPARQAVLQGEKIEAPIENDDFRGLRQMLPHLNLPYKELTINNPGGTESRFGNLLKPDGERVGCLVIELQNDDQYWYLLEKERVNEVCGSLLLATRKLQADEQTITALMDTWRRKRRWPGQLPEWYLQRIAHSFTSAETYAAGILRRLRLPS